MVLRLTKEFGFEMAHALTGYDGKCRNIHGHSYRLFVTVEGEQQTDPNSPKKGMVVDFREIKELVNRCVVEPFDHALVLPKDTPYITDLDTKLVLTDWQPTTENLLVDFAKRIEAELPEGVKLYSLKLHETDSSYAELFL